MSERRLRRNRESARKSRLKKKAEFEQLAEEVDVLTRAIDTLKQVLRGIVEQVGGSQSFGPTHTFSRNTEGDNGSARGSDERKHTTALLPYGTAPAILL